MVEPSPEENVSDMRSPSESTRDAPAATPTHESQSQPLRQAPVRTERRRQRTSSPLYFPLWSLGFTFLAVLILAAAGVLTLLSLRSADSPIHAEQAEPEIKVVAVDPAKISQLDLKATDEVNPSAASGNVEVLIAQQAGTNLVMEGPILPTVAFEASPVPITVGVGVEVAGVGGQELNIRNKPGISLTQILFRAPEGALLDVIGGPQEADGFSWWKVRDSQFLVEGWTVANYLQVRS